MILLNIGICVRIKQNNPGIFKITPESLQNYTKIVPLFINFINNRYNLESVHIILTVNKGDSHTEQIQRGNQE
jgi:hypothetical protein